MTVNAEEDLPGERHLEAGSHLRFREGEAEGVVDPITSPVDFISGPSRISTLGID